MSIRPRWWFLVFVIGAVPQKVTAVPEAILVASGPRSKDYSVVTASVDLMEVGKVTGARAPLDPQALRAELVRNGTATPLACQFQRVAATGKSPTAGTVSVLLPPGIDPGPIRLTWNKDVPVARPKTRVTVERHGDTLTIRNKYYAVTHDPKKMGGLPCRIEFVQSGKVFDSFSLNDRVYDKQLGGFLLRQDASPEVTVLAEGPVYAAVRVKAHYSQGDERPESQPEAVYEFRYYAGLPLVSVRAHVTQQQSFEWKEHHFLEINFPDQSFSAWAGGEPLREGEFKATSKSWSVGQWGALVDGRNVLGMMGCGSIKFYVEREVHHPSDSSG